MKQLHKLENKIGEIGRKQEALETNLEKIEKLQKDFSQTLQIIDKKLVKLSKNQVSIQ